MLLKRKLSVTNFGSENNLPMFRLNAPVVIRVKVKRCKRCYVFCGHALLRIRVTALPPCLRNKNDIIICSCLMLCSVRVQCISVISCTLHFSFILRDSPYQFLHVVHRLVIQPLPVKPSHRYMSWRHFKGHL